MPARKKAKAKTTNAADTVKKNDEPWITNSITGQPMPNPRSRTYVRDTIRAYYPKRDPDEPYVDHRYYAVSNRTRPSHVPLPYDQGHLRKLGPNHFVVPDLMENDVNEHDPRAPKFTLDSLVAQCREAAAAKKQNGDGGGEEAADIAEDVMDTDDSQLANGHTEDAMDMSDENIQLSNYGNEEEVTEAQLQEVNADEEEEATDPQVVEANAEEDEAAGIIYGLMDTAPAQLPSPNSADKDPLLPELNNTAEDMEFANNLILQSPPRELYSVEEKADEEPGEAIKPTMTAIERKRKNRALGRAIERQKRADERKAAEEKAAKEKAAKEASEAAMDDLT